MIRPRQLTAAFDALRHMGPARFLREMPWWVFHPSYVFYAVDPAAAVIPSPSRVSFRLELVRAADLDDLLAVRPGFYTREQVERRLEQGHLAFVARSAERIVHLRWIFVGSVYLPYLSQRLMLAPGEGLLDEVYTPPAWRRRGLETAVAIEMRRMLQARGFRRIVAAMAAWNLVPQRVAEAQGWRRVGAAGYWNFFGYKRFFWRGMVRSQRKGEILVGGETS